jgi:hypothetical protein
LFNPNERNKTLLRGYNLIKIEIENYFFIDKLLKNSYLKQKLIDIGLNEEIFRYEYLMHAILKKVLVLNDRLQMMSNDFLLKAKPTQYTQLYCAQIRINDDRTPKQDVIKFWHFMNQEFIISNNSTDDYRIFITTNDNEMIKRTLSFIDQSKIVKANSEQLNQNIHIDKTRKQKKCTSFEPIVLDFNLLQYCDKIINSKSGFGIFGSLNRPEPFKHLYAYVLDDFFWDYIPELMYTNQRKIERNFTFMKFEDFRRFQYNYIHY